MPFYVYIIRSKDGNYYTGYTGNLQERLKRHNKGRSKHTSKRENWTIVYCEEFDDKTSAVKREQQIKSYKGGRAFKKLVGDI